MSERDDSDGRREWKRVKDERKREAEKEGGEQLKRKFFKSLFRDNPHRIKGTSSFQSFKELILPFVSMKSLCAPSISNPSILTIRPRAPTSNALGVGCITYDRMEHAARAAQRVYAAMGDSEVSPSSSAAVDSSELERSTMGRTTSTRDGGGKAMIKVGIREHMPSIWKRAIKERERTEREKLRKYL